MSSVFLVFTLLIAGLLPVAFLYWKAHKQQRKHYWWSYLIRWILASILLLLLFLPQFQQTSFKEHKPKVVVLKDVSTSAQHALSTSHTAALEAWENKLSEKADVLHYYLGGNVDQDTLKVDSNSSNLNNGLLEVYNLQKENNLAAIVMVTDGINNVGANDVEILESIAVPIHTIGVGDSTKIIDICISDVFYNPIATKDVSVEIGATAFFQKVDRGHYTVSIAVNGQVKQTKQIEYDGSTPIKEVSFVHAFSQTGKQNVSISIERIAAERLVENNSKRFVIDVQENKINAIVVYREVHPDIQAITAALKSQQKFEVKSIPFQSGINWADYDVIIAHQINANLLPKEKAKWIIGNEQGRYISSNQNISFNDASNLSSVLAAHIPSIEKWPPLQVANANITSANTIISQANTPIWYIDLVSQSLITNGVGLWKWKMYNYKHQHSFDAFNQLVSQSLDVLTLKQNKNPLVIRGLKDVYTANEPVTAIAYALNKIGLYDNTYSIQAQLIGPDQKKHVVEINPLADYYKIPLGIWSPGKYELVVSADIEGKLTSTAASFTVDSVDLEQLQTVANWDYLQAVSHKFGGQFIGVDKLDAGNDFIDQMKLTTKIKEEVAFKGLIDFKWLLGLILCLFILDWVIRKYLYT